MLTAFLLWTSLIGDLLRQLSPVLQNSSCSSHDDDWPAIICVTCHFADHLTHFLPLSLSLSLLIVLCFHPANCTLSRAPLVALPFIAVVALYLWSSGAFYFGKHSGYNNTLEADTHTHKERERLEHTECTFDSIKSIGVISNFKDEHKHMCLVE